ncbi:MAG: hypothetical protein WBO09_08185 [Methylocystis silviterrae]|uniref:hypothetical protein n=1 Tax=Methylocystis silviterrae TaxID=2743612 RepID=UPI003C790CB3
MTALPMILEEALRYQGFTIDPVEQPELTITLPQGVIVVPAMVRSELTWRREAPVAPELGADMYLTNLPIFDNAYRPVILSHILDRFRTRRLGYNTPGEWMLAFRRWGNLNMTIPNRRYVSTAVDLPLDNRDETDTTGATRHSLDIGSDFPQSIIGSNTDYASAATDTRIADNATVRRTGRSTSVMELLDAQRRAFVNVDAEILDSLETLFLSVFDQGEGMRPDRQYGYPWGGIRPSDWRDW